MRLFIGDYFSRPSKHSGAWMTSLRDQEKLSGDIRPIILNVCNFTKPTESKPSLLTFDEVSTLFHEFGHALHGLLSDCQYVSLGGTNVYWDFVELPSQIMENWCWMPTLAAAPLFPSPKSAKTFLMRLSTSQCGTC